MKLAKDELENNAKDALMSCLSRVPFLKKADIKRQASGGEMRPDLLVKLAFPEGERYLVVELKANGQPRLAREAINQILAIWLTASRCSIGLVCSVTGLSWCSRSISSISPALFSISSCSINFSANARRCFAISRTALKRKLSRNLADQ